MTPSPSREFLLAAACSIWPPSGRRTAAIRDAAAGPIDWERFLRVVRRHRVVGLVNDGLNRSQITLPPDIAQRIAEQASQLTRQNLELAAEGVKLQRLFSDAGLPVLFIKGVILSQLAYGNLGLRPCKDLDLFIPNEMLGKATEVIELVGYRRFEPPAGLSDARMQLLVSTRKDFGYLHEKSHFEVELHWRLLSNPHFMTETTIISSSRMALFTANTGLRTLGEEDLFSYLCAHGALHWWHQLKWVADIGALLECGPEDHVERLYRAAEARGVGKAAAQAILLSKRLLGTRVPKQLITKLQASLTVRWLEATALRALTGGNGEVEPADLALGTTRGSLSSFLLGRNWQYWLAEAKLHLICQADVLTISLPERLWFLYPIFRLPLWLWRQTNRRGEPMR
jgi:hypothetical protein